MTISELKENWLKTVSFINARTVNASPSERKEYLDFLAIFIGVNRKTLDRWIEGNLPNTIGRNATHVENIGKLYKLATQSEQGNWQLAAALGQALELRNQEFGILENYRGKYRAFRIGKAGLISGLVEITNRNGAEPWMHYHTSTQDGVQYDHQGPVYHVNGRIYVVGIGAGQTDKYFRPMIFKAKDKPHQSVTFGIVLTELAHEYTPLAAKVALVSEQDGRLEEGGFLRDLEERLKIDSEVNVIYGSGDLNI